MQGCDSEVWEYRTAGVFSQGSIAWEWYQKGNETHEKATESKGNRTYATQKMYRIACKVE